MPRRPPVAMPLILASCLSLGACTAAPPTAHRGASGSLRPLPVPSVVSRAQLQADGDAEAAVCAKIERYLRGASPDPATAGFVVSTGDLATFERWNAETGGGHDLAAVIARHCSRITPRSDGGRP